MEEILIIDDSQQICAMLAEYVLPELGYSSAIANTGRQGLNRLRQKLPDHLIDRPRPIAQLENRSCAVVQLHRAAGLHEDGPILAPLDSDLASRCEPVLDPAHHSSVFHALLRRLRPWP